MLMPVLGSTLEFREFTLKQMEGQKPLTPEQIKNAIMNHNLGADKAVRVEIKDEAFSHIDVIPVKFVSEYNKDFSVAKLQERNVGVIITGSAIAHQGMEKILKVAFSYSRTTKEEDMIYGVKGDRAILAPVFASYNSSAEVILDENSDQWIIVRIPSKADVRSYMAVKLIKPEPQN